MKKLLIALALPASLAFVACERNQDRDIEADRTGPTAYGTDEAPVNGERDAFPGERADDMDVNDMGSATTGRGEGELEKNDDFAKGEGELEMSDSQIISQFETDLMSDPDLKAVAGDVKLVAEGDELVLRGTVATGDVGDAIEEYANELAEDKDVKNELTVAED